VSKFHALSFGACEECHDVTVDQFDLCEVESDDTVFLQGGAKDIQVFPCDPTADAKNDTVLNQKSVESAGHGCVRLLPDTPHWQSERHRSALKVQKKLMSCRLELVNLVDLANLEDAEDLASFSET
jgi:hypothetical protein